MQSCEFKNLRILGQPVKMELNFALFEAFRLLSKRKRPISRKVSSGKSRRIPFKPARNCQPQKDTGAFLCSLIKGG
jgi:hypothetical protein